MYSRSSAWSIAFDLLGRIRDWIGDENRARGLRLNLFLIACLLLIGGSVAGLRALAAQEGKESMAALYAAVQAIDDQLFFAATEGEFDHARAACEDLLRLVARLRDEAVGVEILRASARECRLGREFAYGRETAPNAKRYLVDWLTSEEVRRLAGRDSVEPADDRVDVRERRRIIELTVGECFLHGSSDEVTVVPCNERHTDEVVGTVELPLVANPKLEPQWADRAEVGCASEFEKYVGYRLDESEFELEIVTPLPEEWERGLRHAVCTAADLVPRELGRSIKKV